jgi:hypothetical protein
MRPKVAKIPNVGISRLPLESPRTKSHLDVAPWKGAKYTIRGKVVASSSLNRGESYESELPVANPNTKCAPTMH